MFKIFNISITIRFENVAMEHFCRISERSGKGRIRVIFKNLEKLLTEHAGRGPWKRERKAKAFTFNLSVHIHGFISLH